MTQDQIMSYARLLLATGGPLGAWFISHKYANQEQLNSFITLLQWLLAVGGPAISGFWSSIIHSRSGKIATAAALPTVDKVAVAEAMPTNDKLAVTKSMPDTTKLKAVEAMPDVVTINVKSTATNGVAEAANDPNRPKVKAPK